MNYFVSCAKCGFPLKIESVSNDGVLSVNPCNICIKAATTDAYCNGKIDGINYDFKKDIKNEST